MGIKVITPPATEPLSLVEVRRQLRFEDDYNMEDNFFNALIVVARQYCENYQNKKYITQTLELILDDFPHQDYIEFSSCSPVQSVESVKYISSDDTEYTFDNTNYVLDNVSFVNRIVLKYNKDWPTTTLQPYNAVKIRFTAGYGNAADVPQMVKQAMLLLVAHWYENREDTVEKMLSNIPKGANSLLSFERRVNI